MSTAPFLLGGFALWGGAGYQAARRTASLPMGIMAAVWAAMLTVLLTVTFGLALGFLALPHLTAMMIGDPDFARSGWLDARAFAIANQFDSAFSHLLGALIIGTAVGALGAGAALLRRGLAHSGVAS